MTDDPERRTARRDPVPRGVAAVVCVVFAVGCLLLLFDGRVALGTVCLLVSIVAAAVSARGVLDR